MNERTRSNVPDAQERLDIAVRRTAPGTAVRHALDMILAANLGALICAGDVENVLAAGNDGFPLDISFTANRLFELSKMDGAIIIDDDFTKICRANFHLNPDPSLPTSETGMRHRTAARMSVLTKATVIAVSERRRVVSVYVDGRAHVLQMVPELMTEASQLLVTLQTTRQLLDRQLVRLSSLEFDNYVTLQDIATIFSYFEVLMSAAEELDVCVAHLGNKGRTVGMQRRQFVGDMDEEYTLMIRDYAKDSSQENAQRIRAIFHDTDVAELRGPKHIADLLGYEDMTLDTVMTPLGLRTLNRVPVVHEDMADKLIDEYGSLSELLEDIEENPDRLDDLGVKNPSILANSLYRMWGKEQ